LLIDAMDVIFYGELVSLPFQGPASLNGYVVYEKYCNNGKNYLTVVLTHQITQVMHISTDTNIYKPLVENCWMIPGRKFE